MLRCVEEKLQDGKMDENGLRLMHWEPRWSLSHQKGDAGLPATAAAGARIDILCQAGDLQLLGNETAIRML